MEGPTPVSALIHAATMVTAGVYLIVRTHPLFEFAPKVEDLAAGLGAATLLMAGLIALVQTDIKRVIAYSTMSQIGYMFVGAAAGAYPNGMFHLMTHAFFKALLFLAAGIIIHALTGEQDIRKMGGLGKAMPHTKRAFLVGSLALVGIPPFAGLLLQGLDHRGDARPAAGSAYCLFAACLAGAFLTGLYTFRLYFVVFGGEQSEFAREHLHTPKGRLEGPLSMVWTVTRARGCSPPSAASCSSAASGTRSRPGSTRSPHPLRGRVERAGGDRLDLRRRARRRRDLPRLRALCGEDDQGAQAARGCSSGSSTGTSSTTRSSTRRPT